MQGGFGPGRVVTDDCDIVDDLPELLQDVGGASRAGRCESPPRDRSSAAIENNGWRTGVSGLASYTIPKIDVLVSGTFQNQPGAQLNANANGSGLRRPARVDDAGRAFTGAPAGRGFNIVPAGEVFIERLNQIDFRVAKLFRFNGDAHEHQLRLLQRDELELGAHRECDLRRRVENAAVDPAAAPVQDQRAVRLLKKQGRSFEGICFV